MAEDTTVSTRHNPDSVWPVPEAYQAIYAHAVETREGARLLHISGQVGVAPDGSTVGGIEAQCEQAIANVEALLAAAGMSSRDIVKMTCYLTRPQDSEALYRAREQRLSTACPAVTTVIVSALVNPDWLVEIDVTAAAAPIEGGTTT